MKAFFFSLLLSVALLPLYSQGLQNSKLRAELQSKPNLVLIYTKGLVCPSCAVGIKIKLRKLAFIDLKALKRGVQLDTKSHFIKVAIKKNHVADYRLMGQAIYDAGYDPQRVYFVKDGQIASEVLPAYEKR